MCASTCPVIENAGIESVIDAGEHLRRRRGPQSGSLPGERLVVDPTRVGRGKFQSIEPMRLGSERCGFGLQLYCIAHGF